MECYLEFKSPSSEKFWSATTTGSVVNTRWGKLGTEARMKSTEYPSEALYMLNRDTTN